MLVVRVTAEERAVVAVSGGKIEDRLCGAKRLSEAEMAVEVKRRGLNGWMKSLVVDDLVWAISSRALMRTGVTTGVTVGSLTVLDEVGRNELRRDAF